MAICKFNFPLKMQFLNFPRRKNPNFSLVFPFSPCFSFLCCRWNVYQSALILRKLPFPDTFLVARLYYNVFSTGFVMPYRLIDSLAEHFKKIMKMLNALTFSFMILNLINIRHFGLSCYNSYWHIYERSKEFKTWQH